jgi:catalase
VKGYEGIRGLRFNGTHNGMRGDGKGSANGMRLGTSRCESNGAPTSGKLGVKMNGVNGYANGNGVVAH